MPVEGRDVSSRQTHDVVKELEIGQPINSVRAPNMEKPCNAGGGKGTQFKSDARSGEGPGDWATYQLRECSETAEGVAREGVKSCPRAGCGKSASPVR